MVSLGEQIKQQSVFARQNCIVLMDDNVFISSPFVVVATVFSVAVFASSVLLPGRYG